MAFDLVIDNNSDNNNTDSSNNMSSVPPRFVDRAEEISNLLGHFMYGCGRRCMPIITMVHCKGTGNHDPENWGGIKRQKIRIDQI